MGGKESSLGARLGWFGFTRTVGPHGVQAGRQLLPRYNVRVVRPLNPDGFNGMPAVRDMRVRSKYEGMV